MGIRIPNPNLVREHMTSSIDELCKVPDDRYIVCKWVRMGLRSFDDGWKMYVCGDDVRAFLITLCSRTRSHCPPGTVYCLPYRVPRAPAHGLVKYRALSPGRGILVGIFPHRNRAIRRVSPCNRMRQMTGLGDRPR